MMIPGWVKVAAVTALLALAFVAGWAVRGWRADAVESKAVAVQAKAEVTTVHRQDAVSAKVDASATAQAEKTRVVYRTIHDEVLKYVQKTDGSDCVLDPGWLQLHDAAATGVIPGASSAVDAIAPAAGGDQ